MTTTNDADTADNEQALEEALSDAGLLERERERATELETILRVSRAVASTLDLNELMRLILDQLRLVIDYDCASLILIEDDHLVIQDIAMPHEQEFRKENRLRFSPLTDPEAWASSEQRPPLDTPCVLLPAAADFWQLMNDGTQHKMQDALHADDPLAASYRTMMAGRLHMSEFMRSWMATPLHGRAGLIGYFGTSSATPSKFSERHARLARIFADQATVALENARLFVKAQDAAVLEERHRVARDLHDSVAQSLYGVALGAKAARKYLASEPSAVEESLDYVIDLATSGLAEMRTLIFDLYPEAIEKVGLRSAILRQLESLPARTGIEFEYECAGEPDIPTELKQELFAVMREALHNAVRHSQTRTLRVQLSQHDNEVRFAVRDFGTGFVTTDVPPGHLGLTSMRERMARLGGHLHVDSSIGEGAVVSGRLPVSR